MHEGGYGQRLACVVEYLWNRSREGPVDRSVEIDCAKEIKAQLKERVLIGRDEHQTPRAEPRLRF